MRSGWTVFALVALAFAALLAALFWPRGAMASRDIGCAKVEPGRGQRICQALSASMEWTWLGHAIIAPGWRVTRQGLRQVYCGERVSTSDIPVLEMLARGSDWRLESGASSLLRLIAASDGKSAEPETSTFNPQNADYLLKGGCGR